MFNTCFQIPLHTELQKFVNDKCTNYQKNENLIIFLKT